MMIDQIMVGILAYFAITGAIGWLPGYFVNFLLVFTYCFYKERSVESEMFYPPRMLDKLRVESDAFPYFFPLLTCVMFHIILFQAIKYSWLCLTKPFNINGVSASFNPHKLFAACFNMFLPKKRK